MQQIVQQIERMRIIPVVTIHEASAAVPLTEALVNGGLPCAEITYRTPAAEKAIRMIGKRSDILVGAGTVLKLEQVKSAIGAGARFIVTPGFNPKVVEYCLDNKIAIFPGTSTPTDLTMAVEYNLEIVKFFPAEAVGGIKTLKAISAPFPMLKFIPTGGINPGNLLDYLRLPQVIACGGSWLVKQELIRENRYDQIVQLTEAAVKMAKNEINRGSS
jgi:2-dehydro-3-deoxyphosphogluconate aldolase/(4S)-4-hydroxy-2-oxoglutarate aldolase